MDGQSRKKANLDKSVPAGLSLFVEFSHRLLSPSVASTRPREVLENQATKVIEK